MHPYPDFPAPYSIFNHGQWPASWVSCPSADQTPSVSAYRLSFDLAASAVVPVFVSADERYELFLDGARIGRGPERGDPRHWFYEEYTLDLAAGAHTLVARVWAFGAGISPVAQFSQQPGFLLCPAASDETLWNVLATGRAPWQAKPLGGYTFTPPLGSFGVGHKITLDGARYPWGFETGAGAGWLPVKTAGNAGSYPLRAEQNPDEHHLLPAMLPARLDAPRRIGKVRNISAPALSQTHSIPIRAADHIAAEEAAWTALLHSGTPLTVPPNTRRRVLIDLEDYYCAYPEVVVSGGTGASLRLHWQEALFENTQTWDKGQRGEVEGKYFSAMWAYQDALGDLYHLAGGANRRLDTLWWHTGRYVEVLIETSNEALTLESLVFFETRYPLEMSSTFSASDPRMAPVIPIAVRALQMCAHETYMDCPFYEQLMYAGDTRLECLVTYAITADDRLPRKALRMFDWSRLPEGFTQSRYPSNILQMIPPFSLWWVCMVSDYWLWRGDFALTSDLLRGVHAVLDAFTALAGPDHLVRSPAGWNFTDWVPVWKDGVPPGGLAGEICGPLNWQYVLALRLAADLEKVCGSPHLAEHWFSLANQTAAALSKRYWDAARGLYADDAEHTIFTEHSQCLAVLSGLLSAEQRDAIAAHLFSDPDLTQPTVYFMHYYFEACRELGRIDKFFERMAFWYEMNAYDFKTTYELGTPHTTRSDCHAWGAHPLYHYFASVLGIRPSAPGFSSVEIIPQLGPLTHASGRLVHPEGEIVVDFRVENGELHGHIALPPELSGVLIANGQSYLLAGELEF